MTYGKEVKASAAGTLPVGKAPCGATQKEKVPEEEALILYGGIVTPSISPSRVTSCMRLDEIAPP